MVRGCLFEQFMALGIDIEDISASLIELDKRNFGLMSRNVNGVLPHNNLKLYMAGLDAEDGLNIEVVPGPDGDYAWLQSRVVEYNSGLESVSMLTI